MNLLKNAKCVSREKSQPRLTSVWMNIVMIENYVKDAFLFVIWSNYTSPGSRLLVFTCALFSWLIISPPHWTPYANFTFSFIRLDGIFCLFDIYTQWRGRVTFPFRSRRSGYCTVVIYNMAWSYTIFKRSLVISEPEEFGRWIRPMEHKKKKK